MAKIVLEVQDCSSCPNLKSDRVYTADSWEEIYKWTCQKNGKMISSYVEWNDKMEIPNWCPLLLNGKK